MADQPREEDARKGPHKSYSIDFKLRAIDRWRKLKKNYKITSDELQIDRKTLRTWVRTEERLRSTTNKSKRKRLDSKNKVVKFRNLEKDLVEFVRSEANLKHRVTSKNIVDKALELNRDKFHHEDFTASNGWIWRFMKRYDAGRPPWCAMNQDLSGEDQRGNLPGSTSGSDVGNSVVLGDSSSYRGSRVGPPEDEDPGPGVIVMVKVKSEFVNDSFPQHDDFDWKLNVDPKLVDYPIKGESHPVKTENFQSNFLQMSQDALRNEDIKQESCDSSPREPRNATQLLEEIIMTPSSLRSAPENWLLGKPNPNLSTARLPCGLDALRLVQFHHIKEGSTLPASYKLACEAVVAVWEQARIPTRRIDSCVRKLSKMYEKYLALKKHRTRERESDRKKEVMFKSDLEELFDIATKDAMKEIKNEEDREFLQKQREDIFSCSMSGADQKTPAKEKTEITKRQKEW
uniref:uncharacterized protein n=1 Tax=Myxine glutinosa TaxID=7769 RepID=UPI00358FB6CD